MSRDTDHKVAVPRSCLNEFYSKYHNLVETFYYVTLTEDKTIVSKEKPEYVYFNVLFKLNPADGSYDPRELVGRIQVWKSSAAVTSVYSYLFKNNKEAVPRYFLLALESQQSSRNIWQEIFCIS